MGRGRSEITALPGAKGLVVRGAGGIDGWLLKRSARDAGAEFILLRGVAPGAREAARSMRAWGGAVPGNAQFLMEDGRVFRLVFRGGREGRLDLRSWEVSGAYWTARPSARGWRMRRTIAGRELSDEAALLVLFGAEVLRMEGSLDVQEPSGNENRRKGKLRNDARRA